jgi:Na+-driven multidrug efflux pump
MWVVGIPLAFISINILGLQNIALVLLIVQAEQLIRMIIGLKRVGSGLWANNLNVSV